MPDPKDFRAALGSFVTGVTIVTARGPGGERYGLTANSFNSVSLDPPMVLWSLSLRSASLGVFRDAESFAVHILAADQQPLSDRFARGGGERFEGIPDIDGPEGSPLVPGYAARFGCRARFEYEGGDHAIFLGEVISFERREVEPLIYHSGRYGRVISSGEERFDLGTLVRDGLARETEHGAGLTARGDKLLAALAALARR